MTDPKRWFDSPEAPAGLTDYLRSVRVPMPPSASKQAELGRQLASMLKPAATAAAGMTLALGLRLALVTGVVLLAGGWAAHRYWQEDQALPAVAVEARDLAQVASSTSIVSEPTPGADRELAETVAKQPTSQPSVAIKQKPTARDTLADEEALIEQARRLAGSTPRQALSLLQQHQQRYPNGQLAAERMFLSVEVFTRLGDTASAQRQADAIERRFPNSVYVARLRARKAK